MPLPPLYPSARKEIDLRKEFDEIIYGTGGQIPHGSKVILRRLRRDADGFPLKCVCKVVDTNEPDPDCSYCFTGDALVLTSTGYKTLENIQIGELVLSSDGNFYPVLNILKREANSLLEIKSRLRADPIMATLDHPFFVLKKDDIKINKFVPKLSKASELEKGDYLLMPKTYSSNDFDQLILDLQDIPCREDSKNKLPYSIPMNEDILWMFGIWCAEGHIAGERELYFSFHLNEVSYTDRLDRIFRTYFPLLNPRHLEKPHVNTRQFIVANSALAKWFALQFGVGCQNKVFPSWLMELSPKKKMYALEGCWDGDGHIKYEEKDRVGRNSISMTSRQIIYQCQRILWENGIYGGLYRTLGKNGRKTAYSIEWTHPQDRKNLQVRGFLELENYWATEIRSLVRIDKVIPVYDLTVQDGHSFVVNHTLVHNCLGEGFYWDEVWADCYSMYQNSEGGLIKKNINMTPGLLRVDFKVFYFRYDTLIKYLDKVIEVKLDNEGRVVVPYKRITIYQPETIQKYRSDYGRVEYLAVRCREDSALRFDDV